MVKGLLALRLHFDIIGRDPPNDPKVQTQSKEPSNRELGHAVINTSFERDKTAMRRGETQQRSKRSSKWWRRSDAAQMHSC